MVNIKKSSGTGVKGSILICLFFGIFLAVFMGLNCSNNNYKNNGVLTEAEITNINKTYNSSSESYDYTVYVTYTVNGKNYTERLGVYVIGMSVGGVVEIYYMPDDPGDMTYAGSGGIFGAVIFILIAIICGVIFFTIFNFCKTRSKISRARRGSHILAVIENYEANRNVRVNGRSPVRLVCCDDNGNKYQSDAMYNYSYFNLGDLIVVNISDDLTANYVDLEDYIARNYKGKMRVKLADDHIYSLASSLCTDQNLIKLQDLQKQYKDN